MSVVNQLTGGVTQDRVRVGAHISGSSAELIVYDAVTLITQATSGIIAPDGNGLLIAEVTGLDPNVDYIQGFNVDGVFDVDTAGRFTTHPVLGDPASFAFACSSCAGSGEAVYPWVDGISNSPEFLRMRDRKPLFFAHIGDIHYKNIVTGLQADYRAAYDDLLSAPNQRALYRDTPLMYVWDDHDYENNNSDGTYTGKAAPAAVYRQRIPSYDLPDGGAVYHSIQVGRTLIVASDCRFYRSPNDDPDTASKTMLGADQKSWLNNLLAVSSAEALVYLMPVQWLSGDTDSWGGFRTEQDEVVQILGDNGFLDKMVMVNGDYHGLGLDHGSNNSWGGFPVHLWGSVDSNAGGIDTSHIYDTGPRRPGHDQWGMMTIRDRGFAIDIRGTAYMRYPYSWRTHQLTVTTSTPLVL